MVSIPKFLGLQKITRAAVTKRREYAGLDYGNQTESSFVFVPGTVFELQDISWIPEEYQLKCFR